MMLDLPLLQSERFIAAKEEDAGMKGGYSVFTRQQPMACETFQSYLFVDIPS